LSQIKNNPCNKERASVKMFLIMINPEQEGNDILINLHGCVNFKNINYSKELNHAERFDSRD